MTISLCMRCGAEKFGVFNPCKRCAYVPIEDDEIVWAMCVSDHHMDEANRRQVAKQVKAGNVPPVDPESHQEMLESFRASGVKEMMGRLRP